MADTKFEFGFDRETKDLTLIDEVGTPDSSRFWPADVYEPGHAQPSFDKQYVRDWLDASGWDHEPPPPALPDDVVAATAAKYREAYERISGEPFAAYLDADGSADDDMTAFTFEVLVSLKPGLLDPQGKAVEGSLPAMGWTNVCGVRVGKHIKLDVEARRRGGGARAGRGDGRAHPFQPRDRGRRDSRGRREVTGIPRVGVVTFPGSLDDRRRPARDRGRWAARASPCGTRDHDLRGVDAVVLPGGFSYGDYLRSGAIAARAPIMEEVRGFAARGGPVLGICNGFQILCEAGFCPAP